MDLEFHISEIKNDLDKVMWASEHGKIILKITSQRKMYLKSFENVG